MKYIFIFAISILSFSTYAKAEPRNFFITCDSINRWSVPPIGHTLPPLSADEAWTIRIQNDNSSSENYSLVMTHTKSGQVAQGPFHVPVKFLYFKETSESGSISISIPGNCNGGECGQLTADHVVNPNSTAPFIMYGWSLQPLTVKAAMEYRCQVQGID
jgi:hypothetical protein